MLKLTRNPKTNSWLTGISGKIGKCRKWQNHFDNPIDPDIAGRWIMHTGDSYTPGAGSCKLDTGVCCATGGRHQPGYAAACAGSPNQHFFATGIR